MPARDAATELRLTFVVDEVRQRIDEISEEMSPERAAARLRAIAQALDTFLPRTSLVILAAVAIAAVVDHDGRAREHLPTWRNPWLPGR